MVICCLMFPPTRNFEEWLRKFFLGHTKVADSREASYAIFCIRKLDIICSAPPSTRTPSLYEVDKIRVCHPSLIPSALLSAHSLSSIYLCIYYTSMLSLVSSTWLMRGEGCVSPYQRLWPQSLLPLSSLSPS